MIGEGLTCRRLGLHARSVVNKGGRLESREFTGLLQCTGN